LTELREILGEKNSSIATKSKSTVRELTSAKSLAICLKRKGRKKRRRAKVGEKGRAQEETSRERGREEKRLS